LLDALTMRQYKKSLRGLRIAIVGDILHSRVARSNAHLLAKFGAQVTFCGPPELAPDICTTLAPGLRLTRHLEEAVRGTDVIMMLRVQKERLAGLKLSTADYIRNYQLTPQRLKLARRDAIVMHPGPIIRGMELTSVIVEQVANGVPVRMAVLAMALGAAR
jgi:aspartate carbamoyltransferase catalytic subunit